MSCPKCGALNQPGYTFCANCGSPLTAGAPGPTAAAPGAYPPSAGYAGPTVWDAERQRQVLRTKTGVLLLLVGVLLVWAPVLSIVGYILILAGAIFVILGRKAFGRAHARNVVLAIVLVVVGFAVLGVGALFALLPTISALLPGGAPDQGAVVSFLQTTLLLGIPSAVLLGLAFLLFTLSLQNNTGRLLLFAGYGAYILLEVAIFAIVSPAIASIVATAFGETSTMQDALIAASNAFSARTQLVAYLGVIPAVISGAATYIAWARINRGELPPGPPTPTASPPAVPPP